MKIMRSLYLQVISTSNSLIQTFISPLFCMMSVRNTIPDMVTSGTELWLNIHLLFTLVFENVGLKGEEIKWLVSDRG